VSNNKHGLGVEGLKREDRAIDQLPVGCYQRVVVGQHKHGLGVEGLEPENVAGDMFRGRGGCVRWEQPPAPTEGQIVVPVKDQHLR
jgi:hypothetical protein